jgi:hypothetical protein
MKKERKSYLLAYAVTLLFCMFVHATRAAEILMVGNDPGPSFGDDGAVFDYLSGVLGHDVIYLAGADATRTDGESVDLIVISSTLGSGAVRGKFTGLATPILNWEEAIMDGTTAAGNLSMGAGGENGRANPGNVLQILNPSHPLAAGLSGTIEFSFDPIARPHITGSVAPGALAIAGLESIDEDVVLSPSGIGMHIGSNQTGGSAFVGKMDEVAIWSRSLSFQVNGNNQLTGGEAFTVLNQGVSALPNNQGLVGYWSFDDIDDQATALDASANGFDAIIDGGATKVTGDVAPNVGGTGAVEMDGTGMINVVDIERPGGELAYSFWFKPDSSVYGEGFDATDPRVDFFYGNGEGGTVRPHLSANRNGRPVGLYVNADGDIDPPIEATTSDFAADEWHHVLINWDGDMGTVFVNGSLESQMSFGDTTLFAITAVEPGGQLNDGTVAAGKIVNFPIEDVGFTSLTDEGLNLFEAAIAWLLDNTANVPGDFDGDGVLSEADINLLNANVASGANAAAFDLNDDSLVNTADITTWVVDLKNTYVGDANLDGVFNTSDFVTVFQQGKFELDENATWSQGDWNGDLRFNSGDFVAAFQGGGFEQGPRGGVAAVPEPSACVLFMLGIVLVTRRHRVAA